MGVRNCRDIGENLQKIMTRLMANDNLIKLERLLKKYLSIFSYKLAL